MFDWNLNIYTYIWNMYTYDKIGKKSVIEFLLKTFIFSFSSSGYQIKIIICEKWAKNVEHIIA